MRGLGESQVLAQGGHARVEGTGRISKEVEHQVVRMG